jgi:hypothetical protein
LVVHNQHSHPEDHNCNVCRDVEQLSAFNMAWTQKPKFHKSLWGLNQAILSTASDFTADSV